MTGNKQMEQNDKPNISDAWDAKTQLEGYDAGNGATSPIDDDQAIDEETGKAYYDEYYLTVGDVRYAYTADEMEEFARAW